MSACTFHELEDIWDNLCDSIEKLLEEDSKTI